MNWYDEFPGAVTICDTDFTIIYMNQRSKEEFEKYGGKNLIGQNLLDCHNPHSREVLKELMETGRDNIYMLPKPEGRTKLIHQSAWRENGQIKGFVEISFYLDAVQPK